MRRMAIHDQQNFMPPAFHEILQKHDKAFRIELTRIGGGPKGSAGGDSADDIDALSLPGALDHRSRAFQSIGAPQRRIRLKPRLVQEKDRSAQLFGPFLKFWVGFLLPAFPPPQGPARRRDARASAE